MYLSPLEIQQLLSKEDLSQNENHAIGILVKSIEQQLNKHYKINSEIHRGHPITTLEDNYYALNYHKNEITLTSKYTKYINKKEILRTQMSSVIPSLLRHYKENEVKENKLWICPGKVYRRDVRDKTHIGEPHQCDIWYLTKEIKVREDLLDLVKIIISLIETSIGKEKGNIKWRYNETEHNYTDDGIEVEIYHNGVWLEVLECGLIGQHILKEHGLEGYHGLALGLGLERLVMIIKSIVDIRVLYSEDKRIKEQLIHLKKYKEVSKQPSMKRDLSIAVCDSVLIEELTEKILSNVTDNVKEKIESIELLNETNYENLNNIAIDRLGIIPNQKNMLIRIVVRDLTRSLMNEEANTIYTTIYQIIHEGEKGYIS